MHDRGFIHDRDWTPTVGRGHPNRGTVRTVFGDAVGRRLQPGDTVSTGTGTEIGESAPGDTVGGATASTSSNQVTAS